ncbi:MAG: TerB family tellurite resistance protein [Bacteroidales bacterium]|nr:TerB family tellurite resistance protein [Bacteroidales bacterium]MBD5352078.1 TerB family tellurite resistance protein [Bacteroides sp.]MDE6262138.1 TerB family tellurite resistance protein [Muribaculaceae bacterium]MBD5359845.1 TerB family tellurite resistance protein [Bacteroides sp.]MBD5364253.1 TerB family tellurite resistance protein [Bacteroides sp.]
MKTPNATIGSLIAAIIWADGEYSEVERTTISEIAEALEIPEKELSMNVTAALVELKNMDENSATDFAVKHAAKVNDEETGEIFQAILQLALCDNVLTYGEVHNILVLAEALDIDQDAAVLMLCDLVKTEPELEVSFEPEDE